MVRLTIFRSLLYILKVHSTYTVYKRIANLIVVFIGIAVGINLWWVNQQQTQAWYSIQAKQLGRSLSQQKALGLVDAVREQDAEALRQALSQLLTDEHVIAAAVYNFRGKLLATMVSDPNPLESPVTQVPRNLTFVADIIDPPSNKNTEAAEVIATSGNMPIIGYLKVQLATDVVMAHHDQYQQQLSNQRSVFMLLAALGSLYITRAFYKLRFTFQRQWRAKARLLRKS